MNNSILKSDLNATEFYVQSQDRIRRYLKGDFFESVSIALATSAETAQSYSGQVLTLVAANLLSRFCRHVILSLPDILLHPHLAQPPNQWLIERVQSEMYGANPYGHFEESKIIPKQVDYILQLGKSDNGRLSANLVADGDGWVAYIARNDQSPFEKHVSLNPVGPAAAACMAIADIFKVFTGVPEHLRIDRLVLSFFDFSLNESCLLAPAIPAVIDIGRTQMIGVGSVGSSVLYMLSLLPVKGHLDLIDHQCVELVNLDRAPIFAASDVGRPKVSVGERWIRGSGLQVRPHQAKFSEFIGTHSRFEQSPDLVLLLANEHNVYADLQSNFPPLIIYGTTTASWGVNLGRHIPLKEECVLCRYPNQVEPIYKCATTDFMSLQQAEQTERVDASLPFLSFMAGVLATAELLKAQFQGYPFHGGFAYLDLIGVLGRIDLLHREKRSECLCNQQSRRIYKQCLKGSRWAKLSLD